MSELLSFSSPHSDMVIINLVSMKLSRGVDFDVKAVRILSYLSGMLYTQIKQGSGDGVRLGRSIVLL